MSDTCSVREEATGKICGAPSTKIISSHGTSHVGERVAPICDPHCKVYFDLRRKNVLDIPDEYWHPPKGSCEEFVQKELKELIDAKILEKDDELTSHIETALLCVAREMRKQTRAECEQKVAVHD